MSLSGSNRTIPELLFDSSVLAGLTASGSLGVATNAVALCYFGSRFDTGKAVFFLTQLDGVLSTVACAAHAVMGIGLRFGRGEIICAALYAASCLPTFTGMLISAQVAALRFHSMKLARRNMSLNEAKFIKIMTTVVVCYNALYLGSFLYHVCNGITFGYIMDACLGRVTRDEDIGGLTKAVQAVPPMLFTAVSIAYDVSIFVAMKKSLFPAASNSKAAAENKYTVPINATILSAISYFPWLIMFGLLSAAAGLLSGMRFAVVAAALSIVFRVPLTVRLTFAARARVDVETREARQRREREHAVRAREDWLSGGTDEAARSRAVARNFLRSSRRNALSTQMNVIVV